MIESAVALKEPMQSLAESFNVPKTYPELQVRFGAHIEKLLKGHNKRPSNFEDLHNYCWQRLLEAKLLERFLEYLNKNGLKVLKASQVCEFLGVSWKQWVSACVASHTGARPQWMPTPVNLAAYNIEGVTWYDDPSALFSFQDIRRLTFGERINGEVMWPFDSWGHEVRDGSIVGETRPDEHFKYPVIKSTESHFRNYLNRAVLNSHHNFCRTWERRHKERPQSLQGSEGRLTAWEDTLVAQDQASIEEKLAVTEAKGILRDALERCYAEAGVPFGSEDERKVHVLLEQGMTLPAALKELGLSPKARKTVISAIRSKSEAMADAES